jgi:hypothetical protein
VTSQKKKNLRQDDLVCIQIIEGEAHCQGTKQSQQKKEEDHQHQV